MVEPLEASPSSSERTINYVWTTGVLCKPRARVWWSVARVATLTLGVLRAERPAALDFFGGCDGSFLRVGMGCAAAYAACLGIAVIGVGCGVESAGERAGLRFEGTEPGDCEDGADNDADGLFDCDDPGCAASPLCDGGTGGTSGTGGGAGGTSGAGGAGGSMLCATVNCDDQNQCTEDACNPMDGACGYTNAIDGLSCDFGGLPGVCNAGACEDAMLCATVNCDDQNQCTEDACDPMDGTCGYTNASDGTACNFAGLPGVCTAGLCEDAMLCADVNCDDSDQCSQDVCNPMDGQCLYANATDGTACDFGSLPGVCTAGECEDAMLCAEVDCSDDNSCTVDSCDPMDGQCNYANVPTAPHAISAVSGRMYCRRV